MRPGPPQIALTVSAAAHAAALGFVVALPSAAPAGQPAAQRIQLTVAAVAATPGAEASRPTPLREEVPPAVAPQAETPRPVARLPAASPPHPARPRPVRLERAARPPAVPSGPRPPLRRMSAAAPPVSSPQDASLFESGRARHETPAPAPHPAAAPGAQSDSAPAVPVTGANAPPAYPAVARREGWEGTVLLDVRVTPAGAVESLAAVHSSGHAALDRAAADAVRQWRFTSAHAGGIAFGSIVRVPIVFRLERDE